MRKISKFTSLSLAALMAASVMPTAFAAETKLFENDFEKYQTSNDRSELVVKYSNASNSGTVKLIREYDGVASNCLWMLKDGEEDVFKNDVTYTKDESGMLVPTYPADFSNLFSRVTDKGGLNNYYFKNLDITKFKKGGLGDGYYGVSSNVGGVLSWGSGTQADAIWYIDDLCVIKDGRASDRKVLKLSPLNPRSSATTTNNYSIFGHGQLDLNDKLTRFKTDVKLDNDANRGSHSDYSDGWRLSIVKNDNFKDLDLTNYDYMDAVNQFIAFDGKEMYDAVIFRNGNVYMGPKFGTADNMDESRIICSYDLDKYYTVEYYLDLRDMSAPKHTVRILDGENVIGYRSEALTINNEWTTINNKDFHSSLNNNNNSPQNMKKDRRTESPFTGFDAACTNYGVALSSTQKIGTPNYSRGSAAAFVDNFSAYTVDTVPEVNTEISGTVDGKAVAAKVSSLNALTNAQLIAAEYDATTGRFIQYAKADVTAAANTVNQAVTVTFTNDLTANSKIKLFLWDSLDNIASLADSVTVR